MFEYNARLVRVIDGDTVRLDIDLGFSIYRIENLRLRGINTPELNSKDPVERARAVEAKEYLAEILEFGDLTIRTHRDRSDKYGRILADIFLGDVNVNQQMITAGHAVPFMTNE